MVFLLLLGNEKFGHPLERLGPIIDVRRNNNNPIPRRLNEVFAALNRREFGVEGEFGFLKIPFLELLGKLHLTVADAIKALAAMSESFDFENISPFLQLLALKAHDIILTQRKPVPTEDAVQLVKAFESRAKELSVGQWFRVLWSLPVSILFIIASIIVAIVMCPPLFGFGREMAKLYYPPSVVRPDKISILDVTPPKLDLPLEVRQIIASREAGHSVHGEVCFLEVQCVPFEHSTPAFAIEISHSSKPIYDAFAFLEDPSATPSAITIVPQEWDRGRVRLLIPPQNNGGQKLYIVATFQVSPEENPELIKEGIVLRPQE